MPPFLRPGNGRLAVLPGWGQDACLGWIRNGTMGFDFTGKRVLVAGGSRGIGRAIALGFARAGA